MVLNIEIRPRRGLPDQAYIPLYLLSTFLIAVALALNYNQGQSDKEYAPYQHKAYNSEIGIDEFFHCAFWGDYFALLILDVDAKRVGLRDDSL